MNIQNLSPTELNFWIAEKLGYIIVPNWSRNFTLAYKLAQQVLKSDNLWLEIVEQANGTVMVADGWRYVLSSMKKIRLREAYSHPSVTDPIQKIADALTRLCAQVMNES